MFTHLYFNDQTNHGRQLRRCLDQMKDVHAALPDLLLVMATMLSGDGSNATQFDEVSARFGFPDNATAKAAWDELNGLAAKLSTDDPVSGVKTAIAQALAKFG